MDIAGWLAKIFKVITDWIAAQTAISDGSTRIAYQEFTYTLTAGARVELFQVFNYFRVLALSGGTLSTRFGQNGLESPYTGQGVGLQCEDTFSRLTLINKHATDPMTITVALAYGSVHDDRLNVSGALAISSVIPGTTATSLGKAEDAAHTSGDVGVLNLAVRNDSLGTTFAGTTGDYSPTAVDSKGAQFVRPAQLTVTSGQTAVATSAVQLIAANALNGEILIKAGTLDLYVGGTSGVTSSNGFLIAAGETLGINGNMGDIYGIRASGSATAYTLHGAS